MRICMGLEGKSISNNKRQAGSIILPIGSKSDNLIESWHRLQSTKYPLRIVNKQQFYQKLSLGRLKFELEMLKTPLPARHHHKIVILSCFYCYMGTFIFNFYNNCSPDNLRYKRV